ncbi:MAG: hypothetical protein ABFD50_03680 [Smithella sp.]
MPKSKKCILLISDDFTDKDAENFKKKIEPGEYYSREEANIFKFSVDIINSFKNIDIDKYQAILVDYGVIGGDEEEDAIELLKNASVKNIPLAWVGKFYNLYNYDAKKVFPKLKFLHNLPSSSTEEKDVLTLLYSLIKIDSAN